jgi:hypothetical protein
MAGPKVQSTLWERPGAVPGNRMHPTCEKIGKQGRGEGKGLRHWLLTWALASSCCHACTSSELPGALLRGLGLAGCGENLSAREGGGGTQKWVGGKTSPPSHHEGAEARLAPGGRAKARARRPGATCPPACPLPTWPGYPALAGSSPASSPAAANTHPFLVLAPGFIDTSQTRKLQTGEKVCGSAGTFPSRSAPTTHPSFG